MDYRIHTIFAHTGASINAQQMGHTATSMFTAGIKYINMYAATHHDSFISPVPLRRITLTFGNSGARTQ